MKLWSVFTHLPMCRPDVYGHHLAACSKAGVSGRKGFSLKSRFWWVEWVGWTPSGGDCGRFAAVARSAVGRRHHHSWRARLVVDVGGGLDLLRGLGRHGLKRHSSFKESQAAHPRRWSCLFVCSLVMAFADSLLERRQVPSTRENVLLLDVVLRNARF